MLVMNYLKYTAAALSLLLAAIPCAAEEFFFKDGDKIVMMGDSITEQYLHTSYVEAWSLTRFPARDMRFFGSFSLWRNEVE